MRRSIVSLVLAPALLLSLACADTDPAEESAGGGGQTASGGAAGTAGVPVGGAGGAKAGASGAGGTSGAGAAGASGGAAGSGGAGASGGAAGSSGAGASGAGAAGAAGSAANAGAGGAGAGSAGAGGAGAAGASGGAGTSGATTTIRVHYPAPSGKKLTLRGDHGGLSWNAGVALAQGADDTWTFSTSAIDAATEFKPLVDDTTWSRGPNFRVKPGATVDVYPHFIKTSGDVVTYAKAFHSSKLPDDRTVWAYLPPTYVENATYRALVVYMHDGNNLFGLPGGFGDWKADETMDAGAESGDIREAILIGIGNTPARIDEYTPTYDASEMAGGKGDAYVALLIDELKPKVDSDYRTLPGRETTAILGSSLGGLISAYAGVKRPDVFGLVGAMSPSTWWDDTMLLGVVGTVAGQATRADRVYVDSGDSGPSKDDVANTKKLADTYVSVGYAEGKSLHYVVQPGGQHNEAYWAERLPGGLAFLLGPRPDLAP